MRAPRSRRAEIGDDREESELAVEVKERIKGLRERKEGKSGI